MSSMIAEYTADAIEDTRAAVEYASSANAEADKAAAYMNDGNSSAAIKAAKYAKMYAYRARTACENVADGASRARRIAERANALDKAAEIIRMADESERAACCAEEAAKRAASIVER